MHLGSYAIAALAAVTALGLLIVLRLFDLFATKRAADTPQDAWRLVRAGEVLAAFWLSLSVARHIPSGESVARDLLWCALFGGLGFLLVIFVSRLALRALLAASLRQELDRGNVAAGIAAFGHVLATGLLAAKAAVGDDIGSLALALVFFTLAFLTQLGFVSAFRALTVYDDEEQIRGENTAAAVSYAGISIAVAIVIARAVEGDFPGWIPALSGYAVVVAHVLVLYPVRQLVVTGLLLGARPTLRGGALDVAIGTEHSVGMAMLEAVTYIATALILASLV